LAVVADSIPAYEEFAPFCALDDWPGGLRRYLEDDSLRARHAAVGREYVLNNYMIEHAAADWWQLFDKLLSGQ